MVSKLGLLLIFVSLVNPKHFSQNLSDDEHMRLNNTRALNNKVAIVTASTFRMGKAILLVFSQLGAQVVVVGKNAAQVKQVAQQAQAMSPQNLKPLQFVGDVTKTADINKLVQQTISKFGQIDILVNNQGTFIQSELGDVNFMTSFDMIINNNLRAPTQLNQAALQHLKQSKGSIIHISSTAADVPVQQFMAFSMAKAALEMMTKSLAVQLGPSGIRVNIVSPSIGFTNINGSPFKRPKDFGNEEYIQAILTGTPLDQQPNELQVANGCAFLASADANFITGAKLIIDGGLIFNAGLLNTINITFQYVYENEDDTADDSVDNTDNDTV